MSIGNAKDCVFKESKQYASNLNHKIDSLKEWNLFDKNSLIDYKNRSDLQLRFYFTQNIENLFAASIKDTISYYKIRKFEQQVPYIWDDNHMDFFHLYNKKEATYIYNNLTLTTSINLGFENVGHIFNVWEDSGNGELIYLSTLNKILFEGIGGVWIDTIVGTKNNGNLIIGRSFGGDGGYMWGSIWIGQWKGVNELTIIHTERIGYEEFNNYITVVENDNVIPIGYRLIKGNEKIEFTKLNQNKEAIVFKTIDINFKQEK